jgi:hypothetical protein
VNLRFVGLHHRFEDLICGESALFREQADKRRAVAALFRGFADLQNVDVGLLGR